MTAGLIFRLQDADQARASEAAAGANLELVFNIERELLRQRFADDHCARLGDNAVQRRDVHFIVISRQVGSERRLRQRIDTQQSQHLIAAVKAHKFRQHRRAEFDALLEAKASIQGSRQAIGSANNLMCGAAHQALAAEAEGAPGRFVGDVDGDYHSHAQRHAQHEHGALEEAPTDIAHSKPYDDRGEVQPRRP